MGVDKKRNLSRRQHYAAFFITLLFSIRYVNVLINDGFSRIFNQETISTLISYFIFSREPWNYPIGQIGGLTFPYTDGNIGNVGAIPLFAIIFKVLGGIFPYFKTYDYFILIDLASCFFTALYAQKILLKIGVRKTKFQILGALLTGASFLILTRSSWTQSFCVVAFPIFTVWIYAMLIVLSNNKIKIINYIAIVSIYPLASLLDNYSLFAILLGTFTILTIELYEAYFSNVAIYWQGFFRLLTLVTLGIGLSIIVLYLIGMFPLPPVPQQFTSYDFGMGGRYHVSDLFSPLLPVGSGFNKPSLLGKYNFPLTTNLLADGQYEGVAYIGTAVLFIWLIIIIAWVHKYIKESSIVEFVRANNHNRLTILSSWSKIKIATSMVFMFSLGYELHILGYEFPNFSGMPAAWIADRFTAVHNIRAQGRLASMLTLYLIFEGIRQFAVWCDNVNLQLNIFRYIKSEFYVNFLIILIAVIHLIEITPLLEPVVVRKTWPLAGFTDSDLLEIKNLSEGNEVIIISPSWREGLNWETQIYGLAYYSGLKTNIFLIARTLPDHEKRIARDMDWVTKGRWDDLLQEYGDKVIIATTLSNAEKLRNRMINRYKEVQVGSISLWSKIPENKNKEIKD